MHYDSASEKTSPFSLLSTDRSVLAQARSPRKATPNNSEREPLSLFPRIADRRDNLIHQTRSFQRPKESAPPSYTLCPPKKNQSKTFEVFRKCEEGTFFK